MSRQIGKTKYVSLTTYYVGLAIGFASGVCIGIGIS